MIVLRIAAEPRKAGQAPHELVDALDAVARLNGRPLDVRVRFSSIFELDGARPVRVTNQDSLYSSLVASRVAGVAVTTLDNWNKRGILVAPKGPAARLYSFRDLVAIRVLVALREAGIDPRGLKRVVEYLRERKGLTATEALASTVLVTDGHDVYEVEGTASISTLRKPGQAVLHIVTLDSLVRELQREARRARNAA